MARLGPGGLYLFIALVLGLYIPFGLFRLRLVPELLVHGTKATYRTVPRTTAMAYRMLKRPKKTDRSKKNRA